MSAIRMCTSCGRAQPIAAMFRLHRRSRATGQCKRCHYQSVARGVKRWRLRNPAKALRVGRDGKRRWRNGRPACVECGVQATDVHHTTYAVKDRGVDLCEPCHRAAHRQRSHVTH